MQSILSRAVMNGMVEKRPNGVFSPVYQEIEKHSFLNEEKEQKRKIGVLLHNFTEFVKQKYEIELNDDASVECLMDFLDEYSPKSLAGNYENNHIHTTFIYTENQALYLMGEYIKYISEYKADLFEIVRNLSFAYLIAVALSFDAPVEKRVKGLMDVTIYLDTPIIFRLIGLDTEELQKSYLEMFQMYKDSIQPTFKIFQHTMQEITDILSDCARWIDNPAYNPVLANQALLSFIRRKYTKTQIELFNENLEQSLNAMDIFVDEREYYIFADRDVQMDEEVFRHRLIETYKERNLQYDENKNSRTLDYDIHSISNILALWGEKHPGRIVV